MKCYEYSFHIDWGQGKGVVFAENEEQAKKLIIDEDSYAPKNLDKIKLSEIDKSKKDILVHSWAE